MYTISYAATLFRSRVWTRDDVLVALNGTRVLCGFTSSTATLLSFDFSQFPGTDSAELRC